MTRTTARGAGRRRPRWGQNFLVSVGIVERILEAAAKGACDGIVEIGPGRGALTAGLARIAPRLVAVEKDRLLAEELRERLADARNLEILEADALEVPWSELTDRAARGAEATPARVKLVANLPYDVGTPLVLDWLRACASDPRLGEAVVMLQAEVGARLAAPPRTKEYGALGALAQSTHVVERLLDVAPSCFSPAPRVWSRVVRLTRRVEPAFPLELWEERAAFVHLAFAHRRKQLAVSLAGSHGLGRDAWREALRAIGAREDARAEELSPAELAALAATVR